MSIGTYSNVMAFKVLFVIALIGAFYSAWRQRHSGCFKSEYILFAGIGFIAGPIAFVAFVGLLCGIAWLFL